MSMRRADAHGSQSLEAAPWHRRVTAEDEDMYARMLFERMADLLAMMRRQTLSTVYRRKNALLLLGDGWTAERVAVVLFIDAENESAIWCHGGLR